MIVGNSGAEMALRKCPVAIGLLVLGLSLFGQPGLAAEAPAVEPENLYPVTRRLLDDIDLLSFKHAAPPELAFGGAFTSQTLTVLPSAADFAGSSTLKLTMPALPDAYPTPVILNETAEFATPIPDAIKDASKNLLKPPPTPVFPVDINSASFAELLVIPSIDHGRALNIIAFRKSQGPFKELSDLTEVQGITDRLLERLMQGSDDDGPYIAIPPPPSRPALPLSRPSRPRATKPALPVAR